MSPELQLAFRLLVVLAFFVFCAIIGGVIKLRRTNRHIKRVEETAALDANLEFARNDIDQLKLRVHSLELSVEDLARAVRNKSWDGGVTRFHSRFD